MVYADPPWRYEFSKVRAWAVENTYPTMPLEDICALGPRVQGITLPTSCLFLWATVPKLEQALEVMNAWGFTYKSGMVWVKHLNRAGMGYWSRVGHELLLIGARPKAKPPLTDSRFESVLIAKKGKHSEKPEQFRRNIERMFPDARRLEMFAKGRPPQGWTFWGNEVENGPNS